MTLAQQCPKCPLRFDLKPMLADHLSTDHGVDPERLVVLQPDSIRVGMTGDEPAEKEDRGG